MFGLNLALGIGALGAVGGASLRMTFGTVSADGLTVTVNFSQD